MRDNGWERFHKLDMKKGRGDRSQGTGEKISACSLGPGTSALGPGYRQFLPAPNCSLVRSKLSEFLCIMI
jgi:hypothetical protein